MTESNEPKTSASMRKAIAKYDAKFERINARLPQGTCERIKKLGYKSANAFILQAVAERLEREEGRKK